MKFNTHKIGIGLLVICFVITSCNNPQKQSSKNHSTEVLSELGVDTSTVRGKIQVIHEKTMRKIGTLRKSESELHKKMDSLSLEGKDTMHLHRLVKALNDSDSSMFAWMKQYHDQIVDKNPDSIKENYFHSQLQRVTSLKNKMSQAMLKAQKALK